MSPGIFVIDDASSLVPMAIHEYEAEAVLQDLLTNHPALLAGESDSSARRFALIKQEAGVPSQEGGANRWSLDHLFVDNEAIPTFVEVKRATDSRIRREVVGQMVDYAANALTYWEIATLRDQFESHHADPGEALRDLLGEEPDVEGFWERVRTNLTAKKVRLVFVADDIPPELRAAIEFLNEQMQNVEVLGLEVKQYAGESGLKTLVATTIGKTQAAQQAKGQREPSGRERLYKEFWEQFLPQLHRTHPGWSRSHTATRVPWIELPAGRSDVYYSVNFTTPSRIRAEVFLAKGGEAFPPLLTKKAEFESSFGDTLSWEELPTKQGSRIAFYRDGHIENIDDWPIYTKWFLDNVGRLRDVFQKHIDAR